MNTRDSLLALCMGKSHHNEKLFKISLGGGCWWLMPIILATQEAEIRSLEVRSQPGQIVHETLS
jgi:hypothetical protein